MLVQQQPELSAGALSADCVVCVVNCASIRRVNGLGNVANPDTLPTPLCVCRHPWRSLLTQLTVPCVCVLALCSLVLSGGMMCTTRTQSGLSWCRYDSSIMLWQSPLAC